MSKFSAYIYQSQVCSPLQAAQHLGQSGCLLVRQALDPTWVDSWQTAFENCFKHADQRYHNGQMTEKEFHGLYKYGHPDTQDFKHHEQWLQELLAQAYLKALLFALHGPELCILHKNSLPRRQRPEYPDFGISWHQDQEFSGMLRSGFNFWIPLTPAGGSSPGISLWPSGPLRPLLDLRMPSEERRQLCAQIPAQEIWQPELQPGDLLIFHYFILHRSHIHSQMQNTRISYELRVAAQPELQHTEVPFIVCPLQTVYNNGQ